MDSTSCLLVLVLLVIVVVGAGMSQSHQGKSHRPKAGMSVGCMSDVDCGNDYKCAPFDANNNPVKDGAAGICAPWCDENDAAPCNLNGACKGWVTDKLTVLDYCNATAKQPCTTACVMHAPPQFVPGRGKAGFRTSGPQPYGLGGPTDGKINNLLTGGQRRTGGKAGMSVGCLPSGGDCPPNQGCVPFDANNNPVKDGAAGTCVQKCTGPDSCEKKGACQFWESEYDNGLSQSEGYCYSTKDQPCGQPCKRGHETLIGGGGKNNRQAAPPKRHA